MLHGFWFRLLDFLGIRNEAGPGYAFFSGVCGDLTLVTGAIVFIRHKNCHVHRCFRIGRHPVGDGAVTVCRKHHPGLPGRITTDHIAQAHADQQGVADA